jgi:MFS transporter, OFA family, oxalate/formate antiporter
MKAWQTRLANRLPFYYGWIVLAVAVGVGYSSRPLMSVATLSVFVVPMTEHFGWSRGLFSGAVSLGGLCAVAISPLAGRVIDRYGGGVVVATVSAISSFCALGLSLINQAWAFYALYVPGRAGFAGPLELGTSTAVSNWFIRRRPLALALLMAWQGTGLALMPLVAQLIIGGWGWRTAWAALGLFTLCLAVLPPLLLMARRPEDLGLEADPRPQVRAAAPAGEGPAAAAAPGIHTAEVSFTVGQALHTRAFWVLVLFSVAGFVVQAGVSLHQVPHFIQQGVPGPAAATTAGAFALSQTVGGVIWATLARRTALRVLLSLAGFTAALGALGVAASSTLPPGLLAALALGIGVGGFHLLLRLVYADYYGRQYLGSIRGLTIGAQIGGQVIGPIIAGVMFDITGGYHIPFRGFAVVLALAAVLVLAATPPGRPTGSGGAPLG